MATSLRVYKQSKDVTEWKSAPSEAYESILSAHNLGANVGLTPWRQTPSSWAKCLIENSAVLDFR